MAEIRYLHREDTQPIMNLTIGAGLLHECLTIGAGLLYELNGEVCPVQYGLYPFKVIIVCTCTHCFAFFDILIPHLNVIVLTYFYFKKC